MSDFNWSGENVVLRAYGSIAVHENPYGDVVVRQEAGELEEDDHWVVIPVQDAELVAQAIIEKAREIKEGWSSDDNRPPPARQQPEPEPEQQTRLALPAPPPPRPTATKPREGARRG
jgi:hypothetical protein